MQNVPYPTHFHKKIEKLAKHLGGQVRTSDFTYFGTISNQIEHTGYKKHLDHGFVTFYANHPLHIVSSVWGLLQVLKAVSLTLKNLPYAMQNVPYPTHFHKKI